MKRNIAVVFIILCAVMTCWGLCNAFVFFEEHVYEDSSVTCDATDVYQMYLIDARKADMQYRWKWLTIKGKVATVERYHFGLLRVELWGGGGVNSDLRCYFFREEAPGIARWHVGRNVTVTGYCIGMKGRIVLTNCFTGSRSIRSIRASITPSPVLNTRPTPYEPAMGSIAYYRPDTAAYYHKRKDCLFLSIIASVEEITVREATRRGIKQCFNCYP